MAVVNTVTVGGKRIDLEAFTGTVVESHMTEYTSSQAVTRQDGTTGWRYSTSYWNKFRVRGAEGKEWELEVLRTVVTVTRGDQVTLFWGVANGKESNWLAVYNHATEHLGFIAATLNKLAGPPLWAVMLSFCGVIQFFALFGLVQGSLSAWISFLLFCGPWAWVFQRRGAIKQAIRDAIPRLSQAQPLTTNGAPPARAEAHDNQIRI